MNQINKLIDENKVGKKSKENILNFLKEIDAVWGFIFSTLPTKELTEGQNSQIEGLIKEREDYRQNKDWAKADEIKKQLTELGVAITDTSQGTNWSTS